MPQRSQGKVTSSSPQAGWESLGVERQQEAASLPWTERRRDLQHSRVGQAKQKKVKAAEISAVRTHSCHIHLDPNNGSSGSNGVLALINPD